jgi:chromosomal replication initiator protein
MYLARDLTRQSFAEIGNYFGRDHSTVRHACQRVADAAASSVEVSGLLRGIAAELG